MSTTFAAGVWLSLAVIDGILTVKRGDTIGPSYWGCLIIANIWIVAGI